MTLEVLTDVESLALHAAEIVAGEARAAVKVRGRFTVAISGGRTPWVMLRALNALRSRCSAVGPVVSDSEPNTSEFRV